LVSNWAQNYWAVSTLAKKTIYDYKNVFIRVVEPFIGSKDLDEMSLMDIQKRVLATTPHQARLALMILKTLYIEAKPYGMTEKNPTIGLKLPKRAEPKRVSHLLGIRRLGGSSPSKLLKYLSLEVQDAKIVTTTWLDRLPGRAAMKAFQ
jgi:hypothetical protein